LDINVGRELEKENVKVLKGRKINVEEAIE
jgi:hypothetical protein